MGMANFCLQAKKRGACAPLILMSRFLFRRSLDAEGLPPLLQISARERFTITLQEGTLLHHEESHLDLPLHIRGRQQFQPAPGFDLALQMPGDRNILGHDRDRKSVV